MDVPNSVLNAQKIFEYESMGKRTGAWWHHNKNTSGIGFVSSNICYTQWSAAALSPRNKPFSSHRCVAWQQRNTFDNTDGLPQNFSQVLNTYRKLANQTNHLATAPVTPSPFSSFSSYNSYLLFSSDCMFWVFLCIRARAAYFSTSACLQSSLQLL